MTRWVRKFLVALTVTTLGSSALAQVTSPATSAAPIAPLAPPTATEVGALKDAEASKAKAAAAEAKAAAAEAKAAAAEAKAADEKGTADALKTGKLISSGLTGGVAIAVQLPGFFNNDAAKQANPKAPVAMPYILALPAYWGSNEANRAACASQYSGGSDEANDSAARAITTKRATRIFAGIEDSIRARKSTVDAVPTVPLAPGHVSAEQIATELSLDYGSDLDKPQRDALNSSVVVAVDGYVQKPDGQPKDDYKKTIINWMAALDWRASRVASCFWKKFGIWIGIPLNYDVGTTVPNGEASDTKQTASRAVKPLVAVGLAFTPNAYVSLLVGVTASTVTRDATPTADAFDRTIWATTVALGGNLDIVAALAKPSN